LLRVDARFFLLATGGHTVLPPFENNDRPGVVTAVAARRLLQNHQLLVGRALVVAFEGAALNDMREFEKAGARVTAIPLSELVRASGWPQIKAVHLRDGREIPCDALVLASSTTPSHELAVHGGAELTALEGGRFRVACDADGRTHAPDLFVAGRLAEAVDGLQAAESGRRAAQAIARAGGWTP
jgi:sarcosine oxidase subunit alpha